MRFDDPAWRAHPLRTSLHVLTSLVRRFVGPLREAVVSYDGGRSRIVADLNTALGLRLYRYGHDEPDTNLVRRLLRTGDTFVDGGANIGLFTLVGAASVGSAGSVLAFEPVVATRRSLIRNIALNRFDWVTVRSEALDIESTTRSFVSYAGNASGLSSFATAQNRSEGSVQKVRTCTLDEIIPESQREHVALMKLDLEGAEHMALVGARHILAQGTVDLLIELEPEHLARQGASAAEMIAFLRSFGYSFFRAESKGRELLLRRESCPEIRGKTPNLFATKTGERARRSGIALVD